MQRREVWSRDTDLRTGAIARRLVHVLRACLALGRVAVDAIAGLIGHYIVLARSNPARQHEVDILPIRRGSAYLTSSVVGPDTKEMWSNALRQKKRWSQMGVQHTIPRYT